jgi:hypothetical protein
VAPAATSAVPTSASSVTRPVPLPAPSARALEAAARSGDAAAVRQALDVPAEQQLDPAVVSGLSRLRAIHVDESRFEQKDDVSAVVPITTTAADGRSTTWTATLVLFRGSWRIALTEPGPR